MQTHFEHRSNNFDAIRLFLAVLVIFSHSFALATGTEVREPFNLLTRGQATGGHIAVDLFFVISGFLITASYERSKTVAGYLKKRILRIYPGFIVAMLFGALLVVPLSGGHLTDGPLMRRAGSFVVQTLLLREFGYQGAFAANPYPGAVNGSIWSVPYEFWCYIGVILLGVAGALRSSRVLVVLFALTIGIGVLFGVFGWTPGGKFLGVIFGYPPFWARLLPMYLAGVVFYRIRGHLQLNAAWIGGAIALLVAAALIPHGWQGVFPVAGAYLVLALAYHPAIRLHGWNRFGDLSYGTYLYAFPVQQLVMRRVGHPIAAWQLFLVATPVTMALAAMSWHGVERWFVARSGRPASQGLGM